ncbi:MAG: L,D-transpeptidase [Clostridia bacterium]|nr:L,D-transpeptidase [Clostridia bacterium]
MIENRLVRQKTAGILAAVLAVTAWSGPAGLAEDTPDDFSEEIVEEILLDDEVPEEAQAEEEAPETAPEPIDQRSFTPSYGSPFTEQAGGSSFWTTPMDITDTDAIWKMLIEPITVIDIGKRSNEKLQTSIYREPDESSKKIGVVTCESQSVRVIENLDNGWSLIECYSSSFHDTKVKAWNLLVNGYVPTKYLKTVEPDQTLGIVVDKLTQRLYIFQKGKLLSTLICSTGLAVWNGQKYQPYNETRSGEYILMSRVGTLKSDNLLCSMALRYNDGDMIHEVPHTMNTDGSRNYKRAENKLGTKCSHGCIRVQRRKTPEGINMAWLWEYTKKHGHIKIVIWEDWQGRQIPVPADDMVLYYNPNGGDYYHRAETCYMAQNLTFTPFPYSQLEEGKFAKLAYCPYCCPELRAKEIQEINDKYAPGKDHDELLTSLRQDYYEYLQEPD